MKKLIRKEILLLVLLLAILPITSTANDFYATTMPVELEVMSEVVDVQENGESMTIETIKEEQVEIKFTALISCGTPLDIFVIDNKAKIEVFSYPERSGEGQCEIRNRLYFSGENNDYVLVFISPGKDGVYGNNMQRQQLIAKYTGFTSKTRDQIIAMIISDSIGAAGDDDSLAQKIINIKTVQPEIEKVEAKWENEQIVITGETNLAPGSEINIRLVGKGFDSTKTISVRSSRQFKVRFDQAGIQGGDYRLTIETENGDYIDEFCFNIQPSSVTIGTTAAKQEPTTTIMPASAPATPTPTPALPPGFVWPTPTATPMPAEAETEEEKERPYLTILAIIILGIILAVLLIKKIKAS